MQRDARTSNQRHSTNPEPRASGALSCVLKPGCSPRRLEEHGAGYDPPPATRRARRKLDSPTTPRRRQSSHTRGPHRQPPRRRLEPLTAPRSARPPQVAQLPAPPRSAPPRCPRSARQRPRTLSNRPRLRSAHVISPLAHASRPPSARKTRPLPPLAVFSADSKNRHNHPRCYPEFCFFSRREKRI